ncbi:uncharacterized protein LOC129616353 isoform X2 [Condylostylus longicornis]|uniref:uncharacterized protein LOC129616353 isoform X2 n=1 Tax=Condylostylus longicornis TaxID=2530218 RepID=UPI00244E003D|nr:uncharacterized protein LOC129616353 isoform X2 [Condylostylus longicornis]
MPSSIENQDKTEYPKTTPGVLFGSLILYVAAIFLLMSFCSPYWMESYPESQSHFINMGLWEYCFKQFHYPYYQFPRSFSGCHNIFSNEYYVIREWLVPAWLMLVQTFVCISFILTYLALILLSLVVIRMPLKTILQFEWLFLSTTYLCVIISVFGANAYRRDWLLYPKFNVLSWGYSLSVVSLIFLTLSALVLHKECKKAYAIRNESKNLVAQMELQETGYQTSRFHNNQHAKNLKGGYI